MPMNVWDLFFELIPQLLAAFRVLKSRPAGGVYELDLDVRDKATGQDVIPEIPVAQITL